MTVELKRGDYILTKDITKDEYHKIAQKFIDAGTSIGEYPNLVYLSEFDKFGWSDVHNKLHHWSRNVISFGKRELQVEDILGYRLHDGSYSGEYKVGDMFVVTGPSLTAVNSSVIALHYDDNSNTPAFTMVDGEWKYPFKQSSIIYVAWEYLSYKQLPSQTQQPDESGLWIQWNSGDMPVEEGTLVDVEHHDGQKYYGVPAGFFDSRAETWEHIDCDGDIVAYRISNSKKPSIIPKWEDAPEWANVLLVQYGCDYAWAESYTKDARVIRIENSVISGEFGLAPECWEVVSYREDETPSQDDFAKAFDTPIGDPSPIPTDWGEGSLKDLFDDLVEEDKQRKEQSREKLMTYAIIISMLDENQSKSLLLGMLKVKGDEAVKMLEDVSDRFRENSDKED